MAKDVAEMIGHSDTRKMVVSVDEDEKLMGTLFLSGQNRNTWFLTEDGLYEVLMQSRKPIAKAFKKEVKVMLKSIRKHGAYMTEDTVACQLHTKKRTGYQQSKEYLYR
ncbi:BRO-N domain-containing protein [Virgibacillus salexigens]|uniref:BRO-N domain-containing protein n=1 Tax=Virgibacillus massiliensis TaxID=1462526 RepID=UPI001EE1D5C6|nr:Bro-N domain-containing protein [Virgibacillus massiliensis]